MEFVFVFEEARLVYLNGGFISTIILCQALIENWLQQYLEKKAVGDIPNTLSGMLKYCRKEGLLHDFLLQKIEYIRNVRNPFTHPQKEDPPNLFWKRMMELGSTPGELLEDDAKKALIIMHTLYLNAGFLAK